MIPSDAPLLVGVEPSIGEDSESVLDIKQEVVSCAYCGLPVFLEVDFDFGEGHPYCSLCLTLLF